MPVKAPEEVSGHTPTETQQSRSKTGDSHFSLPLTEKSTLLSAL